MSLEMVRSVFELMNSTRAWSVCLLKIRDSVRAGTTYATRGITLRPDGALTSFISRLSDSYTNSQSGSLRKYQTLSLFDGTTEAAKIYKLHSDSDLIRIEYERLIAALATPSIEGDALDFSANAYSLKATLCVNGSDKSVFLFSMQNPICLLKNRFLYEAGTFQEITSKVLNMRMTMDVLIVDEIVYLLTMAGENLFKMERSYRAKCDSTVDIICSADIISDPNAFSSIAKSGHNPRRFVSYNNKRFESIKSEEGRRIMASKFSLKLTPDGKIDTAEAETSRRLVKLLCNKGMVDPFEDAPVEVPSASKW